MWRPLRRVATNAQNSCLQYAKYHSGKGNTRQPAKLAAGVAVGAFLGSFSMYMGLFGEPLNRSGERSQGSRSRQYATKSTVLQALAEIRAQLGDDAVSVDSDDVEEHGHSEWSTSNTTGRPVAILRPTSTEQVSIIAKTCSRYKIPMVPFGAGSSVEGNFASPLSGVCIDLSLMDSIVAFHPDDLDIVVQAGVNWTRMNEQIKDSGLFLPLDPSPTALIGGMISTNCSGTNAMRYGTMKDYIVNLTVVLADGSIIKTRHRPRKTSAGYNLNGLFAGSEGTLGIITEATLKLVTIPEKYSVATATFPTVEHAAKAASSIIRKGVNLAAVELMDDVQMRVVNLSGGTVGRKWEEAPTLFLKFSGTETSIKDNITMVTHLARESGCKTFEASSDEESMASLWSARKLALWACLAARPEGTIIWSTDVAVPISQMAGLIQRCKAGSAKLGLFSSVLGHVGDGNFHQIIMYDPNKASETKAVKEFVDNMMHDAVQLEGTVSGEHGIGLGKKGCLLEELGPATIGVMKTLKASLDPDWLMNPGKVFDE